MDVNPNKRPFRQMRNGLFGFCLVISEKVCYTDERKSEKEGRYERLQATRVFDGAWNSFASFLDCSVAVVKWESVTFAAAPVE